MIHYNAALYVMIKTNMAQFGGSVEIIVCRLDLEIPLAHLAKLPWPEFSVEEDRLIGTMSN